MYKSLVGMKALWLLAVPLPALSWVATGMPNKFWPTTSQWLMASLFVLLALLLVGLYHLCASLREIPVFVDAGTGHVYLAGMWRERPVIAQALFCGGLMLWMHATMVGIPLLADLHRQTALQWNDAVLWRLEQPVFDWIRDIRLGRPAVMALDLVYGLMWVFVVGVLVICVARCALDRALEMTITVGLLFYARLGVAIMWPTAGPAIHQPGHFEFLEGSTTAFLQQVLVQFHDGVLPQNGLMPGLVAMPSPHIGFTWLAGRHLTALVPSARWGATGWLLLTWVTTAVLGWHYFVDGLGGIGAAVLCGALARCITRRLLYVS